MDVLLPRPDPPDGEAVWRVGPDERVTVHPRNLLVMLYLIVPVGLSATLGSITFAAEDSAIASFWPAAAFQVVFPIWFGIYGLVPCVIGPMLGNSLLGESPLAFIPANVFQCLLAAWWFRFRRLDPRLRSARDWFGLAVVGCVLGNVLGAGAGVAEVAVRDWAAGGLSSGSQYASDFARWFCGNALPCWFLAPLLLKAGSSIFIRGPFFCQRFFGAADYGPLDHMRLGSWHDVPMAGKLMILVLLVGLVPLYAIGVLTIHGTLKRAGTVAQYVNQRLAYDNRNEIERHMEMLRAWARQYDRPDYDDKHRKALLAEWAARKDAFRDLEIAEAALIEPQIDPGLRDMFEQEGVVFFVVKDPSQPGKQPRQAVRGVARLQTMPDKVLTGLVRWREDVSLMGDLGRVQAFLVMDTDGDVLYSRGPKELTGWQPPTESFDGQPKKVQHAGKEWYVAEASTDDPTLRIITITSARTGRSTVLAYMPNALAILNNLAIFACVIIGSALSKQLAGRVLEIAEHVKASGGTPGALAIPVRGRDELGYLASTLNHMSDELETYVRELKITTAEKERLAQEMELARQLQQNLLPKKPPRVDGYDLAGRCLPAYEVGGDFYDVFVTRSGRVSLMIGDAVGKGLAAAMLTTETRGIARAAALDDLEPDRVLAVTNHAFVTGQDNAGNFVTLFCAQLDPNTHQFVYASAGHNPPVWIRRGQPSPLEIGGFPIAIVPDGDYHLHQVDLEPGDCVVMYTDGVTEATNSRREMFKSERLDGVVREHATASAEHLIEAVVDEVRRFAEGAPQSDDLTLLIVRRQPVAV